MRGETQKAASPGHGIVKEAGNFCRPLRKPKLQFWESAAREAFPNKSLSPLSLGAHWPCKEGGPAQAKRGGEPRSARAGCEERERETAIDCSLSFIMASGPRCITMRPRRVSLVTPRVPFVVDAAFTLPLPPLLRRRSAQREGATGDYLSLDMNGRGRRCRARRLPSGAGTRRRHDICITHSSIPFHSTPFLPQKRLIIRYGLTNAKCHLPGKLESRPSKFNSESSTSCRPSPFLVDTNRVSRKVAESETPKTKQNG